jgi:hypothetical protein
MENGFGRAEAYRKTKEVKRKTKNEGRKTNDNERRRKNEGGNLKLLFRENE